MRGSYFWAIELESNLQTFFQFFNHFVDLFFGDNQRRNQADNIGASRDDDQAVLKRPFGDIAHWDAFHDQTLHKAHTAAGGEAAVTGHERIQLLFQIGRQFLNMVKM